MSEILTLINSSSDNFPSPLVSIRLRKEFHDLCSPPCFYSLETGLSFFLWITSNINRGSFQH